MGRLTNTILSDLFKALGHRSNVEIGIKIDLKLYADGEEMPVLITDTMLLLRDFVDQNFDRIEIIGAMTGGSYLNKFYNNRDMLTADLTLRFVPLSDGHSDNINVTQFPPISRRYKAQIINPSDEKAAANTHMDINEHDADIDTLRNFRLMLTDINKDTILHKTLGTIVRRASTANAINAIMTQVMNNLPSSVEQGVSGVDVAPGYSEQKHECIVIPHLLEVLAIPKYLQDHEYGVYPGGIGTYIQDNICYIYPPYDVTQVKKGARTVTILNVTGDTYPGAESTWGYYDDALYIISTGEVNIVDPSEQYQSALGAGVQYVNADSIMRTGAIKENGKLFINGKENIVKTSIVPRRDEFNFMMPGTQPITSNHLREHSELAKHNGAIGRVTWEAAKIGVISPGMAVRFISLSGSTVKEYHGVIHRVFHNVSPKTKNMLDPIYTSTAVMDLFLTYDPIDEYDL